MQAAGIARPFRMRLKVVWAKLSCVAVARYVFCLIRGSVRTPIHERVVCHTRISFFCKLWNHKWSGEQSKVERTPNAQRYSRLVKFSADSSPRHVQQPKVCGKPCSHSGEAFSRDGKLAATFTSCEPRAQLNHCFLPLMAAPVLLWYHCLIQSTLHLISVSWPQKKGGWCGNTPESVVSQESVYGLLLLQALHSNQAASFELLLPWD